MNGAQSHNQSKGAKQKAAIYVRMSTDHQKYSTENQEQAIYDYASNHDIDIVTRYADEGKSGLNIAGREALQRLISDVESGNIDFSIILVLDVTRWGRFQDADESAYYEYICRRAGIEVQYVAEQFKNDGSPVSTIIKGVKRAMAGEYSRELSAKVKAGARRLSKKGFRQGGPPGYGLRRMLIDEHGNEKGVLKRGEHKSLQTDRIILVPGPKEEVENVFWVYDCFINKGMRESQIAALLNKHDIKTDLGRAWTGGTIHQILTNEKYIGNNVYNKTSFLLKKRRVVNTEDMWVRAEGVYESIIPLDLFYEAQRIILERSQRLTNEELLDKLKALHEKEGWLSGILIDECEEMPSSSVYQNRFGSLLNAYALIGYTPDRNIKYIEINQHIRSLHPEIINSIIVRIEELGGEVFQEAKTELLIINDEIKASVVISRCFLTQSGQGRWKARFDTGLKPDITIIVRMDHNNESPLDYYIRGCPR